MGKACVECKWWAGSRPAEVAKCDCPLPKSAERYVDWWGLQIRSVMGIAGDNEEDCPHWEAREAMTKRERRQIVAQLRELESTMSWVAASMCKVKDGEVFGYGKVLSGDASKVRTWRCELETKG